MTKRGAEGLEHFNDDHNLYDTDAMFGFCIYSMFVPLQKYKTYPFFWDKNIVKKLCYCNF